MAETIPLNILHFDDAVVAIDKPSGLAVHRSRLIGDDDDYLIDRLRRQVAGPLHLVHRLDRATSGVLLVARSAETAAVLGRQLMERTVDKTYLAIVRGWPAETGTIDHPLSGAGLRGEPKPARTLWRRLALAEIPLPLGRYSVQRYAVLALNPETGRYRQLRRHLHHVSHPIIGDTSHGRGDHNRLWRQHFGVHRLLLHAWKIGFRHPVSGESMLLRTSLDSVWHYALGRLGTDEISLAT